MSWRTAAALVLMLGACTSGPSGTPAASSVDLGDGLAAQRWGDGPYGVVLIGTPQDFAEPIAQDRMSVLVPEATSPEAVEAAIGWLRQEAGLDRVAVVAGPDAVDAALAVGRESPQLVDQLITIDAEGATDSLGPFPKLFIASQTDVSVAQQLADDAPGEWNEAASAPDEAALLALILDRLDERR